MDIFEKMKEIFVDQLGVAASEVTMEAHFQDDLGADSLDIVEMIMELESNFGIEVSDEKAETLQTVGDVVKFIEGVKGG